MKMLTLLLLTLPLLLTGCMSFDGTREAQINMNILGNTIEWASKLDGKYTKMDRQAPVPAAPAAAPKPVPQPKPKPVAVSPESTSRTAPTAPESSPSGDGEPEAPEGPTPTPEN